MTLYLIGESKGKVFTARGPFEEADTDGIYAAIEECERLYNLTGPLTPLYPEQVQLMVVRVAHTIKYRE